MYNGPFHLYFAGRGSKNGVQLKQELGCDQLYSQLNERAHILKDIEYLKEHPGAFCLFVDSGAYTAYTKGKEIDVDDYIDFINKTGDYVTVLHRWTRFLRLSEENPQRRNWQLHLDKVGKTIFI